MAWIDGLGLIAGALTTIAFLPQVYKIWQSRSARDLSMSWVITFSLGISLWLIYGLIIQATPVIWANGITLLLTLVILFFKVKFG